MAFLAGPRQEGLSWIALELFLQIVHHTCVTYWESFFPFYFVADGGFLAFLSPEFNKNKFKNKSQRQTEKLDSTHSSVGSVQLSLVRPQYLSVPCIHAKLLGKMMAGYFRNFNRPLISWPEISIPHRDFHSIYRMIKSTKTLYKWIFKHARFVLGARFGAFALDRTPLVTRPVNF